MFHEAEPSELPAELKSCEDGIFGREGYEGRAGQCAVSIDPTARMSQGVLLSRRHALLASASVSLQKIMESKELKRGKSDSLGNSRAAFDFPLPRSLLNTGWNRLGSLVLLVIGYRYVHRSSY